MKRVDHAGQDSAAVASIRALSALVTQISRPWAALMVVAAVASTLHLNISEKHDLSGSVAVSALTVALLALIWLPSLLRVLGVAGGGVKTPAGEAATPGLARLFDPIDPQTKRETFPVLLTALTSPGVLADSEERTQSEALRRDLELQLAAVMPVVGGIRETLDRYAREYEEIRRSMEPSRERTLRMTSLTAEVRAVARGRPPLTTDLRHMLGAGDEGERIVALVVAQDQPNRGLFDEICGAILDSRSAFEQYHALAAAFEVLPVIDRPQRRTLAEVLRRALDDPDRAIQDDTSRAQLVDALLGALEDGR